MAKKGRKKILDATNVKKMVAEMKKQKLFLELLLIIYDEYLLQENKQNKFLEIPARGNNGTYKEYLLKNIQQGDRTIIDIKCDIKTLKPSEYVANIIFSEEDGGMGGAYYEINSLGIELVKRLQKDGFIVNQKDNSIKISWE